MAPGNHRSKLAARRPGSAGTVAVLTLCLRHTHVTVYVSLGTSTPTYTRSPAEEIRCCVMGHSFQGITLPVLLDTTIERIFSIFPLLSPIPRELIQHSDFPHVDASGGEGAGTCASPGCF